MSVWLLLLVIVEQKAQSQAVYIDKGYPYQTGPLSVTAMYVSKKVNGSPLSSLITFPATPGNYSVYFFIPGLNGVLFSQAYTDYLSGVARHGIIVISTDLEYIVDDESTVGFHFADLYMDQLTWLKANLQGLLDKLAPGVQLAWQNLGIGSHSAGADTSIYLGLNNPGLFKAIVLLDPFATNFNSPANFSLPVVMMQTEFATQHKGIIPPCMLEPFGYEHVWQLWPLSPRVKMEVKSFGHCGMLDLAVWEACYKHQICITTQNASSLPGFHNFNQGISTAFLNTYVNGYQPQLQYVIQPAQLPNYIDKLMVDV